MFDGLINEISISWGWGPPHIEKNKKLEIKPGNSTFALHFVTPRVSKDDMWHKIYGHQSVRKDENVSNLPAIVSRLEDISDKIYRAKWPKC
jgi:hypothetical protein